MEANVYTPGAGHFPPVLAGREQLLTRWSTTLADLAGGGRARSEDLILAGPRGVGKTVALTALAQRASERGFETIGLQAVQDSDPVLVRTLLAHAAARQSSGPWSRARRFLERLGSLEVSVLGTGAGVSLHDDQRPAGVPSTDPGVVAEALAAVARAARDDNPAAGLLLTVDEFQNTHPADLRLLAGALHRLNVEHPDAPVAFAATALTYITDTLVDAGVTHPDRLFYLEPFPTAIPHDAAHYAITEPALRAGVVWETEATEALLDATDGYPAHLQRFAFETWRAAPGPHRITLADTRAGITASAAHLQANTWEPTIRRLSDRDTEYLAAVAACGGRASSRELVHALDASRANDLSQVRDRLLKEGHLYAPRRGSVQLTDELFGRYLLTQYAELRAAASVDLVPLDTLTSRIAVTRRGQLGAGATPGSAGTVPYGSRPTARSRFTTQRSSRDHDR